MVIKIKCKNVPIYNTARYLSSETRKSETPSLSCVPESSAALWNSMPCNLRETKSLLNLSDYFVLFFKFEKRHSWKAGLVNIVMFTISW